MFTIINGLRGGQHVGIFEQCRYIFLTGSRIGHGTSKAARADNKTVSFATDIDFLVSRFWFKLNKQLVTNHIPVSLDIVARSQATLTREVSRKVKLLYEELRLKNLSEDEQKSLYANLTEAERFLEPYNSTFTEDVLTFIDYQNIDDMIKDQKILKQKAAEAEKAKKELAEATGQIAQKDDEIAGLRQGIVEKDEEHRKEKEEASDKESKQKTTIKWLVGAVIALVVIVFALIIVLLTR